MSAITIASVALLGIVAVATTINAQGISKMTFQQDSTAHITAVDVVAHTITVSYMQPLAICSNPVVPPSQTGTVTAPPAPTCSTPAGRPSDVLMEGQILATDVNDQVENDFTKMSVGDSVIVYFSYNGKSVTPATILTPYAIKDVSHSINGTVLPPQQGGAGSGSGTTGTIPPAQQSQSAVSILSNLSVGAQSSQVQVLQQKLQTLGYFPSSIVPSGYFGAVTKQAVIEYQAAMGLPATGFVGSMTREVLQAPTAPLMQPSRP